MKNILAIGEVLFDSFDKRETIGGAPFNFICHLKHFSQVYNLDLNPALISKIGDDARGHKIKKIFQDLNLPLNYLQNSDKHKTGVVHVNLNTVGIPEYDIIENAAYDYIDFDPVIAETIHKNNNFFYFGTLFQRTAHNKQTLLRFLPDEITSPQKVFLDLNLRQDYYNWSTIDGSLLLTNYLKLNLEELEVLKKFFDRKKNEHEGDFLEFILKEYVVDEIIVTKGEKGASIYSINGKAFSKAHKHIVKVKSTVGAGDAFSSVFTLGKLLNWSSEQILENGIHFSSEICKIEGAIPDHQDWYNQFNHWFS